MMMKNKIFILIVIVLLVLVTALPVSADETETTTVPIVESSVAQTDVNQSEDVCGQLEHIDRHLDFFTTVTALLLVVLVIWLLWLLFGRWFFRY